MSRFTPSREFFIPKGAIKIVDKRSDAVAYLYTTKVGNPGAMTFVGKQAKPLTHFTYRDEGRRAKAVESIFVTRRSTLAAKAERDAKRKAFVHAYKVGDVFRTCWGYDQTNVEYFEIVEVLGKFVMLRELAQARDESGWHRGTCTPLPGSYIGEPIRRLAQDGRIKIDDVRTAWPVKPEVVAGVPVYGTTSWSADH